MPNKPDATEVFLHTLARVFGVTLDEDSEVALADAFNDAVEARVEERERVLNRSLDY